MANKPINSVDNKIPPINFESRLLGSDEIGTTYNFKLNEILPQLINEPKTIYLAGDETTDGSYRFKFDETSSRMGLQERIAGLWETIQTYGSICTDIMTLDSQMPNKDVYLSFKDKEGKCKKLLTPIKDGNGLLVGNSDSMVRFVSTGAIEIDYNQEPATRFDPYGGFLEDLNVTDSYSYHIIQDKDATIYSAILRVKNITADTAFQIKYEDMNESDEVVGITGISSSWKDFKNVVNPLPIGDQIIDIEYKCPITLLQGSKYKVTLSFSNPVAVQGETFILNPAIGSEFYPYVELMRKQPEVGEIAYWPAGKSGTDYSVTDRVFISNKDGIHGVYSCIFAGVQTGEFIDNFSSWEEATEEPRTQDSMLLNEGYGSVGWTNSKKDFKGNIISYNMANKWLNGTKLGDSRAELTLSGNHLNNDYIGKLFHDDYEVLQFGATTHLIQTDTGVLVGSEQPEIEGYWSTDIPLVTKNITNNIGFHWYGLGLYDTTSNQINGCGYVYDVSEPVEGEVGTGAGVAYDYLTMDDSDFSPSVLRARCVEKNRIYSSLPPKYHKAGYGYNTTSGEIEAGLDGDGIYGDWQSECGMERTQLYMFRMITKEKWILNGDGVYPQINARVKSFSVAEILTTADGIGNEETPTSRTNVPVMDSNTTPSGVCFSGGTSGGTEPYMAFNTLPYAPSKENIGVTLTADGSNESILGYEFDVPTKANSYSISSGVDISTFPLEYFIEGSDDGTTYMQLVSSSVALTQTNRRYGTFAEVAYKYYRVRFVNVTAPVQVKTLNFFLEEDGDVLKIEEDGVVVEGDIQAQGTMYAEDFIKTDGGVVGSDEKLLNVSTGEYETAMYNVEYKAPSQYGGIWNDVFCVFFENGALPAWFTAVGYVSNIVEAIVHYEEGGYLYADSAFHYKGVNDYYYLRVNSTTNTAELAEAGYDLSTFHGRIYYRKM